MKISEIENQLEQLIREAKKFDIKKGERLTEAFIRNYCNSHNDLRWLRGAFFDEDDKMNTIIEWLKLADSLIAKAHKEGKAKMKTSEMVDQLKKLQEEVERLKKNKYKISEVELLAADNVQTCETVKLNNLNNLEWTRQDLQLEPFFGLGDEVGVWAEDGNHYYNWYAANIIAREIGDGWRLPTKEELENLCKELGKDFYKIMKPELNGGCNSEGGLYYQGSYGYWWSSTPYRTTSAYCMHFYSSAINPSYNNSKNYGLTVRLVREIER